MDLEHGKDPSVDKAYVTEDQTARHTVDIYPYKHHDHVYYLFSEHRLLEHLSQLFKYAYHPIHPEQWASSHTGRQSPNHVMIDLQFSNALYVQSKLLYLLQ